MTWKDARKWVNMYQLLATECELLTVHFYCFMVRYRDKVVSDDWIYDEQIEMVISRYKKRAIELADALVKNLREEGEHCPIEVKRLRDSFDYYFSEEFTPLNFVRVTQSLKAIAQIV